MRLFEIDESEYMIALNKPWIFLIPEFAELIKRDKGSPGDTQARRKLRATREFTYIYFYKDFTSPIRDWEDTERHTEALRYAGLIDKDVEDDKVKAALEKYEQLMLNASRALRTLRALAKGLDSYDKYLESIDFTIVDRDKNLVHNPEKFATQVSNMGKMYENYTKFEKTVENDLKQGATIRGKGQLGDNENIRKDWSEDRVRNATPEDRQINKSLDENGELELNPVVRNSSTPTMMGLRKLVPTGDGTGDVKVNGEEN